MLLANKAGKYRFNIDKMGWVMGINILMCYKIEITKVFSSKMVNEFIFKDVCWFMICRDLKNQIIGLIKFPPTRMFLLQKMVQCCPTVDLYISSSHLY